MAFYQIYHSFFKDKAGRDYVVKIKKDVTIEPISIELIGRTSPAVITWSSSQPKIFGVSGSELKFSFWSGGNDLKDLFTINPFAVQVNVERILSGVSNVSSRVWSGYLNPEVYSEDWSLEDYEAELTANDGFSALSKVPFIDGGTVQDPLVLGSMDIKDVLRAALYKNYDIQIFYSRAAMAIDIKGFNSTFYDQKIDRANFVNEDFESQSCRQVLDWICVAYNLNIRRVGDYLFITDCALLQDSSWEYEDYTADFDRKQETPVSIGVIDLDSLNFSDIKYIDGSQRLDLSSGAGKVTINTSPYATDGKIMKLSDLSGISAASYGISERMYLPKNLRNDWEASKFWTNHIRVEDSVALSLGFTDLVSTNNSIEPLFQMENSYYDYNTHKGGRWVGSYRRLRDVSFDETRKICTLNGGFIPKNTDNLTFEFEMVAFLDRTHFPNNNPARFSRTLLPFQIKCGNLWATGGHGTPGPSALIYGDVNNDIAFDSSTAVTVWLASEVYEVNNPDKSIGIEPRTMTVAVPNGVTTSGVVEWTVMDSLKWYNYKPDLVGILETVAADDGWGFGIRQPNVLINGFKISEDDIEAEALPEGSEFQYLTNKIEIDLNITSGRENGSLDRGSIMNSSNEQEIIFERESSTVLGQFGSLPDLLATSYMGIYRDTYQVLTAKIYDPSLLMDFDSLTPIFEGAISPINVLKESSHGITKNMIMSSGSFDLEQNTCAGVWSGLDKANLTF